ncbi:hypothetical protein CXF68_11245 [Tenacibaculum sp. Bg11-29]|uniref:hypothetical protein n=1 Tax=Tenacibaculum sp. Bg11-29 TaxID=2058306 RepID=UPI000C3306C7|nr:hypothetical protein [Tenacibaculum sp. Bg11-29]PKH51220.1 hypothetical protein CXF68_11245 [Tenacibaculum sp. Bg11-29]
MNKITYIVLFLLLAACAKSIDIEYNETDNNNEANSLVGIWDGPMNCLNCCSKKYRYTLTITKHENEFIEGKLKISSIPEQQYFAIFNLEMNLESHKLIINTNGKQEAGSNPSCGNYCTENTYELLLSLDKKSLNGIWSKSNECTVSASSTSINLEKQ